MQERWYGHVYKARTRLDIINRSFWNALRKYGESPWTHEVLDTCSTIEEAKKLEVHYIALYDTYNRGYNGTPGGDYFTQPTTPWSKGKKLGPLPEAQRQKIAAALKGKNIGKRPSDECFRKSAEARRGKPGTMTGRTHSPEARAKLSAAGKKRVEQGIKPPSTKGTTFKLPEEAYQKVLENARNPQFRAEQSERMKAWWAARKQTEAA